MRVDIWKVTVLVLLFALGGSIIHYQGMLREAGIERDAAYAKLDRARENISDLRNRIDQLNERINFLQNRTSRIKNRNAELRDRLRRPLVYTSYASRSGSSGDVELNLNLYNFGNKSASSIEISCKAFRQGTDSPYKNMQFTVESFEGKRVETITRTAIFDSGIRSGDQIFCRVDSCSGSCTPLRNRLESFSISFRDQRAPFN
ncbi:MAG: hypothetical protein ABEJ36_03205 [Candidatus Nanosalina sp.]